MSETFKPAISAIIPIYNGRRFLREAVESVIAQTLPPVELILVDDGSTDDSLSVLDGLEFPFPVVKIRQENAGQSAARNRGMRETKSTYVAFLDQDDIWCSRHLEWLVRALGQKPGASMVYGDIDEVDANGKIIISRLHKNVPGTPNPKKNLPSCLGYDLLIFPSAAMIDRDFALFQGGFPEQLCGYEDDYLFTRLIWMRGCAYVDRSITAWRHHDSNASFTRERAHKSMIKFADLCFTFWGDNHGAKYYWGRELLAPRFARTSRARHDAAMSDGSYEEAECYAKDAELFNKLAKHGASRNEWLAVKSSFNL